MLQLAFATLLCSRQKKTSLFSLEKTDKSDLFFFFGSFWSFGTFILAFAPSQLASQALSATYLPVKKRRYDWGRRVQAEGLRRQTLASLDLDTFCMGDDQGHLDGRQGIRLGEPSVQILAVLQESVVL